MMEFENFSNLERLALNIQALYGILAECYDGMCCEYRGLARLSTSESLGESWTQAITYAEKSADGMRAI